MANDGNAKSVTVRLNGDSGTNYDYQHVSANSTTVNGQRVTGTTSAVLNFLSLQASEEMSATALIAKPSASVPAQSVSLAGNDASPDLSLIGGEWNNTADAISSISIQGSSGNLAAGTSVLLEGLAP